ncbi:MAG: hypothetical protein MSC31_02360 [Solirubrobacteraceae bacterium MAG38_C4-C5]|nr:hypothetical protein [Candidatus Siliceabacter maunaloa]
MSTTPVHVCDACEACWWGASKRDVLDEGWKFHDAKRGRILVVCGDCEARFAQRRAIRRAPAALVWACACEAAVWEPSAR